MTAELSDDARAIAGGLFGSPCPVRRSVRYNRPFQLSPRAEKAFAELVDAGVVSCLVSSDSVTFTQLTQCADHYAWLRSVMHTGVGKFDLTEKARA